MILNSYLYFSIFIISKIVFFDILIKFKRPFFLKIVFLFLPISIGGICLIISMFPSFSINAFGLLFLKAILACSFMQLFSVLYFPKSRLFVNVFTTVILIFTVFSYLYLTFYIPKYLDNYHSKSMIITVDEGFNVPMFFKIAKRIFFLIFFTTWIYFLVNIITKFKISNIYFDKIKIWSINILVLSVFVLFSNILSFYLTRQSDLGGYLSALIFLYTLLIILYRPAFLNRAALKIKLGEKFLIEKDYLIKNVFFENEFYTKMYFLNKEASMDSFALQLNVSSNDLYKYIYNKFNMSFNDLLNKNRVAYFLEVIKISKFKNYTIDALAQEAGFTSRQHLYKPFKKFHGGNPSDLVEAKAL